MRFRKGQRKKQIMIAVKNEIRTHLDTLTKRWGELIEPAQFEVRCLEQDTKFPTWAFFTPGQIDQAVDYVESQNSIKNNCYVTVNPIRLARRQVRPMSWPRFTCSLMPTMKPE